MRGHAAPLLLIAALLGAQMPALQAEAPNTSANTVAQDLVGSWHLVSIEVVDSTGTRADPFYGSGTTGLLIYDASGWVSVQIAGAQRPRVDAPATRPGAPEKSIAARSKAKLLDGYYAYYGTWQFDPATATVTHRVQTSLYSGEEGASYTQHVQLAGRRLVFSRTRESVAGKIVQRKVWEKINPK